MSLVIKYEENLNMCIWLNIGLAILCVVSLLGILGLWIFGLVSWWSWKD
jgi:hypothetical protein